MTVLPNQSSSMRRVAKCNEPFTGKEAAALDFWCRLLLDTDCDTTARAVEVSRSVFEQYCEYFDIDAETFADKVVVDIGCGPAGALHHFQASHKFGVDVLAKYYTVLPIDWQDIIYLGCAAEQMPLMDEYVDVVISSNALDHVASFESAIRESYRVLKVGGRILAEINLRQAPTLEEPMVISEQRVQQAFAGLFEYRVIKRLSPNEYIPTPRIIVDGTKLQRQRSTYTVQAEIIVRAIQAATGDTYERQLTYMLEFGAPRRSVAEYCLGSGFRAYHRGDKTKARERLIQAIGYYPPVIANRGVLSVLSEVILGPSLTNRLRALR